MAEKMSDKKILQEIIKEKAGKAKQEAYKEATRKA